MIPFIEYLFENFAPEIRPVIAGLSAKPPVKNPLENVVDIIWVSEKKLKEISQYLNKEHNIKAEVEKGVEGQSVISIKLPVAYGNKAFQLFPENVLVLYDHDYTVYDSTHEPHRVMVHRLNMAYPKKFKYQKKA